MHPSELHLLPTLLCSRLPRARWLVTTLGARGSVLLQRPAEVEGEVEGSGAAAEEQTPAVLHELVKQLFEQAAADCEAQRQQQEAAGPDCVSGSGVPIHCGGAASTSAALSLGLKRGEAETQRILQAAAEAAAAAAAANADAGNAARYAGGAAAAAGQPASLRARVTATQAARLPEGAVVDTTGAGDAFIGSMIYGVSTGMPVQRAVQLASVVAACKCTALGPRPGLPRRANLRPDLLQ